MPFLFVRAIDRLPVCGHDLLMKKKLNLTFLHDLMMRHSFVMRSGASYEDPLLSQLTNGLCVPIDATPPHPPTDLTIMVVPSDVSDIDCPVAPPPPIVNFPMFHEELQLSGAHKTTVQPLLVTSLPI